MMLIMLELASNICEKELLLYQDEIED